VCGDKPSPFAAIESTAMDPILMDLMLMGLVIGLFAASYGLVALCEKL
jgi:hypothetical protein